jgi:hypothetical protein
MDDLQLLSDESIINVSFQVRCQHNQTAVDFKMQQNVRDLSVGITDMNILNLGSFYK